LSWAEVERILKELVSWSLYELIAIPQVVAAKTYSDVDAKKKGEVSRKALAVAAPRASSEKLLKCIVVNYK
jgi:hypothetical protein